MEKVELLKKIKHLAHNTEFSGEQKNAEQTLQRLMQKYGITEDELNDEVVELHKFTFLGERQYRMLNQVFYHVFGNPDYKIYNLKYNGKLLENAISVYCTKSQKVEVELLYDFYVRLYEQEEEMFYSAFIQKHRIFGDWPENRESSRCVSESDILQMSQFIAGMNSASPRKQLANHININQ